VTWWRMDEVTCLCGWLRHVRVPRGTETPASRRVEQCGVSWPGSTSFSSLPSRTQRRWPWGLSQGTRIGKLCMWESTSCCFARLVVQPSSSVPHPLHSLWEGHNPTPQGHCPAWPPQPGVICPRPLPAHRSPGKQYQPQAQQQHLPPPCARAQEPAGQAGKGTWWQRDTSLVPVYGWLVAWRGRGQGWGGHPAASGCPPSCNRSWEQLCEPCPASRHQLSPSRGQKWVCRAPGLRPHTLPGQSTHGCTGSGQRSGEAVPGAMLVPARGARRSAAGGRWAECCGRMAAASSCSRSVGRCHGIAPSSQAALGDSGNSYFGQPKAPQLSCSLQHGACAGAGTRLLPWAALKEVHTLPMGSPSTPLPTAPRGEPHPGDEVVQCRADMGDAEPIQKALCLPAGCDQGRGTNSPRTCSPSMSSHQWSPCLCPGPSLPAARVHSVKHKSCTASWVLCVLSGWAVGRAALGPSFKPCSRWPWDTAGLPTHLAAHPSQSFAQAGWILHGGIFPGN